MANYEATRYDFDGANITGIQGTETGSIIPWPKDTAPTGFLLCDGTAVSRSTYADLFAVIGETYGNGDGATTFNVPDLQGKMPQGYESGVFDLATSVNTTTVTVSGNVGDTSISSNQLAQHSHPILLGVIAGGPVQYPQISFVQFYPSSFASGTTGNDASHNHDGSNLSGNAFSPYLVVNYIIKT